MNYDAERLFCKICDSPFVMTESRAVLCVNGCGLVQPDRGVTKAMLRNAVRDRERLRWLREFPESSNLNGTRRFIISQGGLSLGGLHTFAVPPGRKTSRLAWLEVPLDGFIVAQHNGFAHYFKPREEGDPKSQPAQPPSGVVTGGSDSDLNSPGAGSGVT